jgi:TetR/AcrR family transcriptional regulator, cholesterol catabolism regulator
MPTGQVPASATDEDSLRCFCHNRAVPRASQNRTKATAANGGTRRRDQEVLNAAVKVFHERGYAAATVQDVADELGILKGSLYHYIDTKEDLLFRLCEAVHRDVEAILEDVRSVEGVTALERLDLFVRRQVEYNLEHLPEISVYYHDADQLEGSRKDAVISMRRANTAFVSALIKEAQDAGEAEASIDARLLTNCLFATIIWTYRWYRPGGRDSRQKIADACAAYAIGGLRGTSPAPAAKRPAAKRAASAKRPAAKRQPPAKRPAAKRASSRAAKRA